MPVEPTGAVLPVFESPAHPSGLFASTEPQEAGEREAVWGVDGSTLRVSIAAAWELRSDVATRSFDAKLRGGARLAHIFEETLSIARELAQRWPPAKVFVEQPSGKWVSPELSYAIGTTMAALGTAVSAPVETIPSGTWKLEAMGYGAAKKHDIMPWARRHEGYQGNVQDEADALGIARGGYRILHRPQQQQLSA